MSEKNPTSEKTIILNGAEKEGLRRVMGERDERLAQANALDQYLRRMITEVILHHGEDVNAGWSFDPQRCVISCVVKIAPLASAPEVEPTQAEEAKE